MYFYFWSVSSSRSLFLSIRRASRHPHFMIFVLPPARFTYPSPCAVDYLLPSGQAAFTDELGSDLCFCSLFFAVILLMKKLWFHAIGCKLSVSFSARTGSSYPISRRKGRIPRHRHARFLARISVSVSWNAASMEVFRPERVAFEIIIALRLSRLRVHQATSSFINRLINNTPVSFSPDSAVTTCCACVIPSENSACGDISFTVCFFVVLLCFFVVTPATKSTKFGSIYLGEGSSERDEILQVGRGRLAYLNTQTGNIWPCRSPWGAKILKA